MKAGLEPDLRGWFAADPARAQAFTLTAGDLHVDLSKNLIDDAVLTALVELAEQVGLAERRDAMFAGEKINVTEGRAVLHTALRDPDGAEVVVDGTNVVPEVHHVLEKVYGFADRVRNGEWKGVTGKPIATVVNIGIGGSDLGPVMVYEALQPYVKQGLTARFVSNIDPTDVALKTADLDPETTLFIVASKTFTTLETLTNARLARAWLLHALQRSGAIGDAESDEAEAHRQALRGRLHRVGQGRRLRHRPGQRVRLLGLGGRALLGRLRHRYVAGGGPRAGQLRRLPGRLPRHRPALRGDPDRVQNVPALMGLLNVWYRNFFGAATHAVLPYAQLLHRFPAYLQQLTMESNGKSVRWDGSPVTTDTGEVFWGEPGTNGQHAFYQLIHQGTQLIPADFIAVAKPAYPLEDGGTDVHELFLANFFAQTAALAFGKTADEVRAEGTAEEIVPARVFSGNRPTTSIMAPALTPSVVGQLIALYEHITFTQGIVWGIDSFDQWGVELGKQLALKVTPAVGGDEAALAEQDPSTQGLIRYYREQRG